MTHSYTWLVCHPVTVENRVRFPDGSMHRLPHFSACVMWRLTFWPQTLAGLGLGIDSHYYAEADSVQKLGASPNSRTILCHVQSQVVEVKSQTLITIHIQIQFHCSWDPLIACRECWHLHAHDGKLYRLMLILNWAPWPQSLSQAQASWSSDQQLTSIPNLGFEIVFRVKVRCIVCVYLWPLTDVRLAIWLTLQEWRLSWNARDRCMLFSCVRAYKLPWHSGRTCILDQPGVALLMHSSSSSSSSNTGFILLEQSSNHFAEKTQS